MRIFKELESWKLELGFKLELYEVREDFTRGDALERSDEVLDFTEVPNEVREDLADWR